MSSEVVFKVSVEAAKAIQTAVQFAGSFAKVEGSYGKAAQSGKRYESQMNALSVSTRRAITDQQKLRDVIDTVARAQSKSWGSSDLSITRTGRALARQGGSSQFAAESQYRSFDRFVVAKNIKDDRAFSRFLEEEEKAATEMAKLRTSITRNRITTEAIDRRIASARQSVADATDHQVRLNNTQLRQSKRQKALADGEAFTVGAAGVIGASIYGAASYAQNYAENLDRIGTAGSGFEREIRPLMSLRGFKGGDRVRDRVLGLSGAYGRSTGEITNALYELDNNAGNLGKGTKSSLFSAGANMTNTSGGDLNSNVTALTKVWQIYGQELGSVAKAQAKVQKTADESAASIKDVAEMIPDILPAAKAFGYSFDEVAASIITATQLGGSTEKTFTALRNVFLSLSDAEKEGIHLTGGLTDKLKELGKTDPEILKKVFGERTVTTLMALADNTDRVAANLERMQRVTSNDALLKTVKMLGDAKIRDSNLRDSLTSNLTNVDVLRAQDATTRNDDLSYKLMDVGYQQATPMWMRNLPGADMVRSLRLAGLSATAADSAISQDSWKRLGLETVVNQKLSSGDEQSRIEANMLQLKYGSIDGMGYRNSKGKTVATDDSDVANYATMLQAGHHLSAGQYTQYRTLQEGDPTGKAAASYLASLDAAAAKLAAAAAAIESAAANLSQTSTGRVGRNRNNNN